MSARRVRLGHPLVRVLAVVGLTVLLGWYAAGPVTGLEAAATARLARWTGLELTRAVPGTNLVRGFHGYQPFYIRVTPSCSALTVGAAAAGVSLLILGGSRRRRVGGAVLAVSVLALGNLVRLAAVLWVGQGAGIPAMVTFHDWGGTVFSYALLLAAVLLLIAVRLPGRRRARSAEPPLTEGPRP
ncbi:hypothetical protein OHV05_34020 [Kitasatospora sp. NBC_00070]|uniref:hypothetical protein n=1 Tax=Kitasatospora sp. NBC_00070 TaxID=2975962 RepID=UPI0032560627